MKKIPLLLPFFFFLSTITSFKTPPSQNSSSNASSIFYQRLKNTIHRQIETSYTKIAAMSSSLNPPYAYNALTGFDPSKKVVKNKAKHIATSQETALREIYLKENYDEETIGKIFQNLKNVNPYTMLADSPMTFLKAEPQEDLEQPTVTRVIMQEKIVTNPDEFPRFLEEKMPIRSPTNEFAESGENSGNDEKNNNNNIFVVRNPPEQSPLKTLSTIEKIPIFVPIPIFGSFNVPVYHHQDYQQKIREIIPEVVSIPVEHQTMEPVPVVVQREQRVLIPQQAPYGVKIPYNN